MTNPVLVERVDAVLVLTLNRPSHLNALDATAAHALGDEIAAAGADRHVAGVVITGAGKAFCAGGDLRWVAAQEFGMAAAFRSLTTAWHRAVLEIRKSGKPVVAAINGAAAGGGFSLALACDFRVMARSAVLRQGYTSMGLSIDAGGTHHLPRLVGSARALEIAALDEPIDAAQALAWGLATRVAADGDDVRSACALVGAIAQRPLHSFAASKRLLHRSLETPLEDQLDREQAEIVLCGDRQDVQTRIRTFVDRRRDVRV